MPNSLTLPIIASLSIVGGALGVHFGRTTVAEINPDYLSDKPQTRFHADLVANGPNFAAPPAAGLQPQQATIVQGLGRGCVGCKTFPEEYRPARDAAADVELGWTPPAEAPAAAAEQAPLDADQALVLRYASAPITEYEVQPIEVEQTTIAY